MSDKKYPFLEIKKDEENLLFSTPLQEQARIGHLRGDFGSGNEFWTTWRDQHEEFKGQDFKDELDDLVNTLRKNGPLKNLSAMQQFCWDHPQAQMSPKADSRSYAFRVDTERHRYYLRFIPERGDYNFYIHCYRSEELKKDAQMLDFAVSCLVTARFTGDSCELDRLRSAFAEHVQTVYQKNWELAEHTVGDVNITFDGLHAEISYTFAYCGESASKAEAYTEGCVREVQGRLEQFGWKLDKVECFAEELELDGLEAAAPAKGRSPAERKKKRYER